MATFIPAPSFSAVPSYQSSPYVSGFGIAVTGNTTLTVQPGMARALASSFDIAFSSFSAGVPGVTTVDVSTVGLNGCYPVSIASLGLTHNTLFPVYVVANASGTSVNPASPSVSTSVPGYIVATGNNFLPAGMNAYKRIGWVAVAHSSGNLIVMTQVGNNLERKYFLQDPVAVLATGSATAQTVLDLTANDGLVPSGMNVEVMLNLEVSPNGAAGYLCVEAGNVTAGSIAPTQLFGSVASVKSSCVASVVATPNASTGNANIQYFVDNSGSVATINLIGFVDSLDNELI